MPDEPLEPSVEPQTQNPPPRSRLADVMGCLGLFLLTLTVFFAAIVFLLGYAGSN